MTNSPYRISTLLLFPCLLASMVLIDQPYFFLVLIGQILGWISYILSFFVVLNSFKGTKKVVFFYLLIFIVKGLAIITSNNLIQIIYIVLQDSLFCISGAIILYVSPKIVYQQVVIFCWINLIIMFLQVSGLGAVFPQLLTTHGESINAIPVNTLFTSEDNLNYLLIQGRPAGLMDANVLLSLFILFAISVHFSNNSSIKLYVTPLLCAALVLSMAKIAFIGFFIALFYTLYKGTTKQKKHFLRACLFIIIFILIYLLLFPGLASVNLSKETINTSFFLRINEIISYLDFSFFDPQNVSFLEGTSQFTWGEEGEFASGISGIIILFYSNRYLISAVLFLFIFFFVRNFIKLKKFNKSIADKSLFNLIIVGLFPFTHPIWQRPIFWLMIGFGLLPIIYLFNPKFLTSPTK